MFIEFFSLLCQSKVALCLYGNDRNLPAPLPHPINGPEASRVNNFPVSFLFYFLLGEGSRNTVEGVRWYFEGLTLQKTLEERVFFTPN